jgi:Icc-related predicted phosphoesterase
VILGIVSDLHLNFSGLSLPTDGLDALAVIGDTSPHHRQAAHWLEANVPAGLPVLLVLGNHDHEGLQIDLAAERMREAVAHLANVRVLHNETAVVAGVRFLGTPLWTRFDAFEPSVPRADAMAQAKFNICDFGAVLSRSGRLLSPADMVDEHRIAREFLERELRVPHAGKTVVLSHFLPSPKCCDTQFSGSALNPYFATNVEDLLPFADLWAHGHTHASVDRKIRGTRVVCNPRGYSRAYGLSENADWDPSFRVDLGT